MEMVDNHRHLQQNEDMSGYLVLRSLQFFILIVVLFIVCCIVCGCGMRFLRRKLRMFWGGESSSSSSFHNSSVQADSNRRTNGGDNNNDAGDLALDSFYLRERIRAEIASSTGGGVGAGAYEWMNGLQKYVNTDERRAFLDQALLEFKFQELLEQPQQQQAVTLSLDQYDTASCAICLEEYQMDDKVCRSYNKRCQHLFHRDCILDWLVKDETCPCCRQHFLEFYEDNSKKNQNQNNNNRDLEVGRQEPLDHDENNEAETASESQSSLDHSTDLEEEEEERMSTEQHSMENGVVVLSQQPIDSETVQLSSSSAAAAPPPPSLRIEQHSTPSQAQPTTTATIEVAAAGFSWISPPRVIVGTSSSDAGEGGSGGEQGGDREPAFEPPEQQPQQAQDAPQPVPVVAAAGFSWIRSATRSRATSNQL